MTSSGVNTDIPRTVGSQLDLNVFKDSKQLQKNITVSDVSTGTQSVKEKTVDCGESDGFI